MGKHGRAPIRQGTTLQLVGTDDLFALYSDVFVVAREDPTDMVQIYFYQGQMSATSATLGTTNKDTNSKARCVARILFSPQGIRKLVESLAENQNFTLTPKPKVKGQE